MADESAKKQLFEFLDQRAFQPVLKADAEDYSGKDREKLDHVQRATRSERERYQNYGSAQKLFEMYRDDLSSEPAQEVQSELEDLGLPTLHDVRDEFERKAEDVGVR